MIRVLDLRPQIDALTRDFGTMGNKQLPHAVRDTVNAVARDVQSQVRQVMRNRLRMGAAGRTWADRQVRILTPGSTLGRIHVPQGTDGRHKAFVGIIPSEGKGQFAGPARYRGSLLAMLEEGGETPGARDFGGVIGLGRQAIPVVSESMRPRHDVKLFPINLKLQARRSISGGLTPGALKGKKRTYLVKVGEGRAMIFQRYGKERDATMPLFSTQNRTRLPARRYFFSTANRVVRERFDSHFQRSMQQALFGRGAYRSEGFRSAASGW
jgi:hypothetical protein